MRPAVGWQEKMRWQCFPGGGGGDGGGSGGGGGGDVKQHMGTSHLAAVGWEPTGERTDNNLNRYQPGARDRSRLMVGQLEAGDAFLANERTGETGGPGAGRPAS